MEYVVLRAGHPRWLNLQLPSDVAELLQFPGNESTRAPRGTARRLMFFHRLPGIVRVAPSQRVLDVYPLEMYRRRFIAEARVSDRLLFNLPAQVVERLGLQVAPRPPNGLRGTDDGVIWMVPAPEYYEWRARERSAKPWTGPSTGGIARVYMARSVLPLRASFDALAEAEARIEADEWQPRLQALEGLARARP
jgi:hypothetical protein